MSDVTIPGGKIRAFVERIETLDAELQELNEQKKEVFAEAKGEGFDVKILKEIIKLRKQNEEERDERESMLDLYMRAMEQAGPEKLPRPHDQVRRVAPQSASNLRHLPAAATRRHWIANIGQPPWIASAMRGDG
jgi:uncharacterized protein (UPF0335 family)